MSLTFHILSEHQLALFKTWFTDPAIKQRIAFPTDQWFDYVRSTPDVYAWMIFDGEIPVGYVQLDVEGDNCGSAAFAVRSEYRGQGYGKRILSELVNRQEVIGLNSIEGYVEVDNISGQQCLISAGFQQVNTLPDKDGMIKFVYRL
jgi:ribosomal protein S18 acetylase RimI-like enzyme